MVKAKGSWEERSVAVHVKMMADEAIPWLDIVFTESPVCLHPFVSTGDAGGEGMVRFLPRVRHPDQDPTHRASP